MSILYLISRFFKLLYLNSQNKKKYNFETFGIEKKNNFFKI